MTTQTIVSFNATTLEDFEAALEIARQFDCTPATTVTPPIAPKIGLTKTGRAAWGPNVRAYCDARGERRFCRTRGEREAGMDDESAAAARMAIDGWQGGAVQGEDIDGIDGVDCAPPPPEHDGTPLF